MGIDNCKPTSIKHPIREGYGKSHNLFLTRFSNFPSVVFSTFFDYGCPSCYISSSLAFKLNPYKSTSRSIMSGIGGKGPTVTHDVLVNAQFCLSLKSKEYWTTTFTVSVGLVPDKTFPGDLVLGQTMFHALGLQFLSNGKVKLLKLLNEPVLTPTNNNNSQTLSSFSATEMRPIKWHPATTEEGLKFGAIYTSTFPSLFDKSLRQPDTLSNTTHRIDTGNHTPIKLPPRRYSPVQLQAIRDFCKAHDGTIIRKSKSPWAAPLLLTPKKTSTQTNKTV